MSRDDNQTENALVNLVDDEGREVTFEHIMTIEHQGSEYAMLVPVEGFEDDDEDGALVVLKILPGADDGDDCYEGVTDEKLLAKLYEIYLEQVEFTEDE